LRKPIFFIIGAPKCDTISLSVWLGDHPKIFMAPIERTHFFNSDDRQAIRTLDEYEALFCAATEKHIAVGEASVWYLSSAEAVPAIPRHQPAAKFIIMLRNPVEIAPALHGEMPLSGLEQEQKFSTAWNLQDERSGVGVSRCFIGRNIPNAYTHFREHPDVEIALRSQAASADRKIRLMREYRSDGVGEGAVLFCLLNGMRLDDALWSDKSA